MPRNPPHRVSTRKTAKALERMVPPGWHVAVSEAIVIEPENKPEPDVAVVPAELEYDATRDPLAVECYLVVEVAESSLEYDRTKKLALYATAGIPVYWIVNPMTGWSRSTRPRSGARTQPPQSSARESRSRSRSPARSSARSPWPACCRARGGRRRQESQVLAGLLLRQPFQPFRFVWATTPRVTPVPGRGEAQAG